jgi:hypothetical protein
MILRGLLVVAALALLYGCGSTTSAARSFSTGAIQVTNVWVRAAGENGAAYATITNSGSESDKLLRVASDSVEAVELHTSTDDHGVMKMNPVDGIDIPARATVALRSGHYHAMLIGIREALEPGTTTRLTLEFEKAGELVVEAEVRP